MWITNGIESKQQRILNHIPDGWRKGKSGTTIGKIRITNGPKEQMILLGEKIPVGWRRGRRDSYKEKRRFGYAT